MGEVLNSPVIPSQEEVRVLCVGFHSDLTDAIDKLRETRRIAYVPHFQFEHTTAEGLDTHIMKRTDNKGQETVIVSVPIPYSSTGVHIFTYQRDQLDPVSTYGGFQRAYEMYLELRREL